MGNNLKDTIEKGKEDIKQAKLEHNEKQTLKKKRKFVLKIFRSVIAILVLVLLIIVVKLFVDYKNDRDEPTTNVSHTALSQLIDVKDIAELQVANVTYDSVATITKDGKVTQKIFTDKKNEKENVDRYVSYKGQIIVSYDLEKVEIEKDDYNKLYIVSVPEPDLEPNVIGAKFDHIIIDEKSEENYKTEKIRELCLEDLKVKFNKEKEDIESVANSNMQNAINAYLELFIEDDYEIKYETLREVSE